MSALARTLRAVATLASVAANLIERKSPTDHIEARFAELEHSVADLVRSMPAGGVDVPDETCATCGSDGCMVLVCGRQVGKYEYDVLRCTNCGAAYIGPMRSAKAGVS